MDLTSRLRQAFGNEPQEPAQPRKTDSLQPTVLPGRKVQNQHGVFWKETVDFPLNHPHGRLRLESALGLDADRLALLSGDPGLADFVPEKAVFIDTETTSLGGGAGTYVFMAGIGYFTDKTFRVEQYFMRDYDEEPAMLAAFNERCAGFQAMVTFFGKNFDRYRLEDRMAALGMKSELPVSCHLDLYHVSRRLYHGRFPNLKLKTLEEEVLGFLRRGDLPGAECPEAYFQYLRGFDGGRINDVFTHNLWDILSLNALATEVEHLAADPKTPLDCYALACVYLKARRHTEAQPLLERACAGLERGPRAYDAHLRQVKLLKKQGNLSALEARLHHLLQLGPDQPEALEELAKFYEHKRNDYPKALLFARQFSSHLLDRDDGSRRFARQLKSASHRIQRLQSKSDGLQSKSDGLQSKSGGLQSKSGLDAQI